jgi:hypothetical protein
MDLADLNEEILYAGVGKIGEMANAFEGQIVQNPQEYWVLQPDLVYQDVSNGGPPFQIQDSVFARWLQNTKTQCPVILRHILNFFRQWVCFDPNRNQPVPKDQLQPFLRNHAATYLLASPTTARMTIGAALAKLMKYAKVFASEGVGKHMVKFVDFVIYKYIAEELCEAVDDLNRMRKHLELEDEICSQVLQQTSLFQAVVNGHGFETSCETNNNSSHTSLLSLEDDYTKFSKTADRGMGSQQSCLIIQTIPEAEWTKWQ